MASAVPSRAAECVRPRAAPWWSHTVGSNLPLEAGASGGQRLCRYVFVHVHGLGVLSQVIKARESSGAVTLEWSFTGVLAG